MSGFRPSDELRALFRPVAAHARLASQGDATSRAWLRRPLVVLAVLASTVSLMTAGRLTLVLVLDALVAWSFVPALHVAAALVAARWLGGPRRPSRARVVDLYFIGFGPWLLWLAGLIGVALFARSGEPIWSYRQGWLFGSFAVAFGWAAWVHYGFFRGALGLGPVRAALAVVTVRAWSWGIPLAWFWVTDQLWPRLPFVQGQG